MSRRRKPKALLVGRVNFVWYPLTLIPILALVVAGLAGWLPSLVGLLGLFCLFFWIFSLGFALFGKLRPPKEPRQ